VDGESSEPEAKLVLWVVLWCKVERYAIISSLEDIKIRLGPLDSALVKLINNSPQGEQIENLIFHR
jgi:hypothetical protein